MVSDEADAADEVLLRQGLLTRSWSMIQLGTNVLPPSKENDCSQRADVSVISVQRNRTPIWRPW
jgi:hypothetical protein